MGRKIVFMILFMIAWAAFWTFSYEYGVRADVDYENSIEVCVCVSEMLFGGLGKLQCDQNSNLCNLTKKTNSAQTSRSESATSGYGSSVPEQPGQPEH